METETKLPPNAVRRLIVVFVEEDAMSVILAKQGDLIPTSVRVVRKQEVILDKSHAQILDGLVTDEYEREFESNGINGLLREAVKVGMQIQATATERAVAPPTEI